MKVIKNLLRLSLVWLILAMTGIIGIANGDDVDPAATVSGRYSELLRTIHCPSDAKKYGEFKEYGYRAGEDWCGYPSITGYLVWVSPNWYVWRKKIRSTGSNSRPFLPGSNSIEKKSSGRDCRPVHTGVVTVVPC